MLHYIGLLKLKVDFLVNLKSRSSLKSHESQTSQRKAASSAVLLKLHEGLPIVGNSLLPKIHNQAVGVSLRM